ncbi:hypothetical protein AC1031_004894 [Aphanomyces cochlioides]|nr:hypothetical protein AC1031_004894 [Aphanomyces cochlioides]
MAEDKPLIPKPQERQMKGIWALAALALVAVIGGTYAFLMPKSPPTLEFCDTAPHEFGYVRLPHKVNDSFFYSFFQSRNKLDEDPLVVWLEGGPGSSSTWALFNVNGPCKIADDSSWTVPNPYSWTSNASMIWLDQPTGVGFSIGDARDGDSNEDDVGRNVHAFLQGWLDKHPPFRSRPLFLAGQSYGGHYIPAAASYIVKHAKDDANLRINLQGIAIGNGSTDTVVQMPRTVDMAVSNTYNRTLVTPSVLEQLQKDSKALEAVVMKCQNPNETQACLDAHDMWNDKILTPMITNPDHNEYDLRDPCVPSCKEYGMAKTEVFLNRGDVQRILGVDKVFAWNNATVFDAYTVDFAKSTVHFLPDVLAAGVRVLLYAGDADLICDWKGIGAFAKLLEWPGRAAYNGASVRLLEVAGESAGEIRSSGGLSFVRVFHAGHAVPVDQPAVALELVNRFFQHML